MTVLEYIDKTTEHVTLATGMWFYQHLVVFRKRGKKRTKSIGVNAIRYDQCIATEQNLVTLALNVQITNGQRTGFFTDIDDVTEEWKNEHLWFIDFPTISWVPRILVSNDHSFIKRKIKTALIPYFVEIASGNRDWWSGRVLKSDE